MNDSSLLPADASARSAAILLYGYRARAVDVERMATSGSVSGIHEERAKSVRDYSNFQNEVLARARYDPQFARDLHFLLKATHDGAIQRFSIEIKVLTIDPRH